MLREFEFVWPRDHRDTFVGLSHAEGVVQLLGAVILPVAQGQPSGFALLETDRKVEQQPTDRPIRPPHQSFGLQRQLFPFVVVQRRVVCVAQRAARQGHAGGDRPVGSGDLARL